MPRGSVGPASVFAAALAGVIDKKRDEKGLSVRALAKEIGRSHTYLQKMLNRQGSVFDANDIEKVAVALGVSVESIVRPALALRRDILHARTVRSGQITTFDYGVEVHHTVGETEADERRARAAREVTKLRRDQQVSEPRARLAPAADTVRTDDEPPGGSDLHAE